MAPLTISTIAQYPSAEAVPLQQLVGNEFDALIEWFAASSSSSSSGSASVSMPDSCEPVDYNDTKGYGEGVGGGWDRNGGGEYDPLRPGFSLVRPSPLDAVPSSPVVGGGCKMRYFSAENSALEMEKEKDAEGYDPSNPKLSLPMRMLMRGRAYPSPPDPTLPLSRPSLPAPSLPPTPRGPAVTAPRSSSSSSITSAPRSPSVSTSSPLPTSQLLIPSSTSSDIANPPLATERGKPHWKGDRRRFDAMKQRRIEERRERRGRDPVTGAKVVMAESGKLKAKGTKKGKGEKVASGRVGKA